MICRYWFISLHTFVLSTFTYQLTHAHNHSHLSYTHTHARYELQSDPTRLTQIACAGDFPSLAASCQESKLSYSWDCSSGPSEISLLLEYQFFLASTLSIVFSFFFFFFYFLFYFIFYFFFSVRIIEKLILCTMMNV